MIDVFRALDKDSSGGITAEELVASELGAALSPVQVTCLLQCTPPVTHKHTHTRAHTQAQK
jgi:Ca2+-binding EF-hand superfamily protein